jgi:hypothetical protein
MVASGLSNAAVMLQQPQELVQLGSKRMLQRRLLSVFFRSAVIEVVSQLEVLDTHHQDRQVLELCPHVCGACGGVAPVKVKAAPDLVADQSDSLKLPAVLVVQLSRFHMSGQQLTIEEKLKGPSVGRSATH